MSGQRPWLFLVAALCVVSVLLVELSARSWIVVFSLSPDGWLLLTLLLLATSLLGIWFRPALFVAFAIGLAGLLGGNTELMPGRLLSGTVAAGVLCACLAFGLRLLLFVRGRSITLWEKGVIGLGLGLAILSTLTLVLGSCGLLYRNVAVLMLLVMVGVGSSPLKSFVLEAGKAAGEGISALSVPVRIALMALLLGVVVLVPAAFMPPLDYDVTEYHAELPRTYVDAGRIDFVPENAFSGFPQGMEMLTYLSFQLVGDYHGDPIAASHGIWIAKLLNLSFLPLMLAAIVLTVWRTGGDLLGGVIAAISLLACFSTSMLSFKLYVELGLGAYMALSLLMLARFWRGDNGILLAGIFAGAAACCKYTGLIYVGAPLCLAALSAPQIGWRLRIRAALVAGFVCWLTLSPWLIKNLVTTGNPVYPLWNQRLGVAGWSEAQQRRFHAAHHSTDFSSSRLFAEVERLTIGGDRIEYIDSTGHKRSLSGVQFALLGLIFAPGLLCFARGKRLSMLTLLLWYIFCFFVWFYMTHRLERFFHQGYLLGCVLSGLGFSALVRVAGRKSLVTGAGILVIAFAMMSHIVWSSGTYFQPIWDGPEGVAPERFANPRLSVLLGMQAQEDLLAVSYRHWRLRQFLLQNQGAKVMMVGAADPFWLPAGTYEYGVVFSVHPLWSLLRSADSVQTLTAALRERGVTHLYVDWGELSRLHATYVAAYDLSPGQQKLLRELMANRVDSFSSSAAMMSLSDLAQKNSRLAKLLTDYEVLFPERRPAGEYGRASKELFRLW